MTDHHLTIARAISPASSKCWRQGECSCGWRSTILLGQPKSGPLVAFPTNGIQREWRDHVAQTTNQSSQESSG